MPNWTSNIIRAEGVEADIQAFLAHVRIGDEPFDFNTLIPMPALLKHTASGFTTIDGQELKSWYVIDPARTYAHRNPGDPPNERAFTAEEQAALNDIGHDNWYRWCNANWGTKWNACDTEIDHKPEEDGAVEIRFNTAWAAPFPVFRKLAAMFPALSLSFRWTDEDDPDTEHSFTIRAGDQP